MVILCLLPCYQAKNDTMRPKQDVIIEDPNDTFVVSYELKIAARDDAADVILQLGESTTLIRHALEHNAHRTSLAQVVQGVIYVLGVSKFSNM